MKIAGEEMQVMKEYLDRQKEGKEEQVTKV